MLDVRISAEVRKDFGKNASRRLRQSGKIPGIIYGRDYQNQNIAVDPKDIVRILESESGHNTIFSIDVDTGSTNVLIRDYQLDPVKGTLIHADFQKISMDEVMEFDVPVQALGTPKGVKEHGGVVDVVLREVKVECLPSDVPDNITIDVSELEIGESLRVEDLQIDTSKITVLSDADLVVITLVAPRVEAEAPVAVEEEVAEPELIKRGRVSEEEGEAE